MSKTVLACAATALAFGVLIAGDAAASDYTLIACPVYEKVNVTKAQWDSTGFQDMWVLEQNLTKQKIGLYVAPAGITRTQLGPGAGDITPYANAIQLLRTAYVQHLKVSMLVTVDGHIETIETTTQPCN